MKGLSRRRLLASTILLPGAAAIAPGLLAAPATRYADTVIKGGRIYSMDEDIRDASVIAIRGDRILAVGGDDTAATYSGPRTHVIDARDQVITPGFIDAHSHPLFANEAISINVDVRTISEVQALLRRQAADTPGDHWVLAHMYDDTKFVEGRALTRQDIDAAVSTHPVQVSHRGGHTAVMNSYAFELAGITNDTLDPPGGRFFREQGELIGTVAEKARRVFADVGIWPVADRTAQAENAVLITKRMAASGLTSTTEAAGSRDDWLAYQDAYNAGNLSQRISFMPRGESDLFSEFKELGIRSGFGDTMIGVGAVKYVADGSASERTMRMSTPFEGKPDDYGILTMDQGEIDAAVDDAIAHGFRIGIHANGDVTIDMTLNAYERALKDWQGANPRFRIEHCSLVNPSLIQRIKAIGAIPAPFYTYAHYHGNKWLNYGPERMEWMFAHKSLLDAGIPVAPASDYTPGPYEPMMAIQSMVTRKDAAGRVWGPSQKITVEQAMQVCTINGAYASTEEKIKGSITPGKLADLAFLGADPHSTDPDEIKNIPVLRTMLGGRTTFMA